MNKNRKKYVRINNHTSSDEWFWYRILCKWRGHDDIAPDSDNADFLTPEASIHIVKDNEKEQEKNSKSKLEEVQFQWRRN